MKGSFNKTTNALLSLCCLSLPVFSSTTTIIYGLDNATHYANRASKSIIIQTNSFNNINNARRYQKQLLRVSHYPVTIVTKNTYHRVMIGPIPTAQATRQLANMLLHTNSYKHTIAHHTATIKPTAIALPKTQPTAASTTLLPSAGSSNTLNTSVPPAQWFVSVGTGEQYPQINNNTGVNNGSGLSAPYNQDLYSVTLNAQPVVTAAIGRRWQRDSFLIPSYSLSAFYQYFSQSTVHGNIMQYSLPAYTNYNYSWNVSSNMVLASAKLNLFKYERILPYINGGIGSAFTRASQYNEYALAGVTPRTSPGFSDNNNQQFAYNGGVGIDVQINPHALISVGYLYQNLGNVSLGQGTGPWSGQNLSLGTYQSNEVMVNVSYLFEK